MIYHNRLIKPSIYLLLLIFFYGCSPTITEREPSTSKIEPTHDLIGDPAYSFDKLSVKNQSILKSCDVSEEKFNMIMSLDFQSFDQNMNGGWREVANQENCNMASSILIGTYLARSKIYYEIYRSSLRWHMGQMLAYENKYEEAIPYFENTYHANEARTSPWNLYVDGTIAFLKKDKALLRSKRDLLAKSPVSESMKKSRQKYIDDNPEVKMYEGYVDEPMNMPVMNDLLACFDQPYSKAYGNCEQ
jgi:hypothetical protein